MNGIYCGEPPLPLEIWSRWNLDPILIAMLMALFFALRRTNTGRAAVLVLAVAFVSPLCALSSALFAARSVHHMLLVIVAAPLIAASLPPRRAGSLAFPFIVATAFLWLWHLPAAYDLALSHKGVYWLMQITLLSSAIFFWRAVLAPGRSVVDAIAFIVASFAQMGLLAALLTFSPTVLYQAHQLAPLTWGLAPLADQQLGGLIMWVPSALPYALIAALIAQRGWADLARGRA